MEGGSEMQVIEFWKTNINPITGFQARGELQNQKYHKVKERKAWVKSKNFVIEDYTPIPDIKEELGIGSVLLQKHMEQLGFEKVIYKGKRFYKKEHVQILKESGVMNPKKEKLDRSKLITAVELSELYECKPWNRHRIVVASELKPVMRNSGQTYYDKELITPFFEAWKKGELKFKPRKTKKK